MPIPRPTTALPSTLGRREFLAASAGSLLALAGTAKLFAADVPERLPDGSATKDMITPAAQRAIDRGLEFLARRQYDNGSFGERHQYQGNVAITSLAALAMMSGGHQPGRGPRGDVVNKALNYVMSKEQKSPAGFLHSQDGSPHGPMYSHGFGTLFLAEVHGMILSRELRDRVRNTLKRAVKLIIDTQNGEGGWRYFPQRKDADISVTICQIMALRAARNAGIAVPKSTVDNCVRYVKDCQDRSGGGGFRYMKQSGHPAFARSAAGVVALYSAGVYKGPEIERGLEYLMQFKPGHERFGQRGLGVDHQHYFYGHYYAAQAMWTAGGDYWKEWYPAIRDELVSRAERMRNDGGWSDAICSHYATAMALIILQIPNNYLPILQK